VAPTANLWPHFSRMGAYRDTPPLICGRAEFDEMEQILRSVLTEAWATP
jgi:hypothetical protein